MRRLFLFVAFACALVPMAHAEDAPRQSAEKLEVKVPTTFNYLLYLPKDHDKQDKWPLLIFLHGAGERGDDLAKVKVHGPPKLIEQGKDYPFVVISPQCPKDRWWQPTELLALVDAAAAKYKIDPDRIYLTGLSMGGFGTWGLAALAPERFAAIMPICGGGETLSAARLAKLPVWAFHGAQDKVVPLKRSEDMVEALKKVGGDVKLTVYPEAGHDSWTETYNNPEVYTWLLSHQRNAPPAAK